MTSSGDTTNLAVAPARDPAKASATDLEIFSVPILRFPSFPAWVPANPITDSGSKFGTENCEKE